MNDLEVDDFYFDEEKKKDDTKKLSRLLAFKRDVKVQLETLSGDHKKA